MSMTPEIKIFQQQMNNSPLAAFYANQFVNNLNGDTAQAFTSMLQSNLIRYVELPEIGRAAEPGEIMAVVESLKAASEVYAPVAGTVVEVNEALVDAPEKINEDAEGDGWFVRLSGVDADAVSGLMDGEAYATYVEGLD